MPDARQWRVEILVGEDEGRTYAEAVLRDDIGNHVRGAGRAQVAPDDTNVPEVGDEIAVARALRDLSHRLLAIAKDDVEELTHEKVRLHE
jgi:hypothetical protein